MSRVKNLLRQHRPLVVLMGIIIVLTTIPAVDTYLVLGTVSPPFPPTFTDETFYYARMQTIVKGYTAGGNPYFLEHRNDPPLVIFGGAWIDAIPQLLGLSFNEALWVNMIVWSLLFASFLYWLFWELRTPRWVAVFGTVLLYIESYWHMWRPVNFQPIFPFYFLFYIALLRLIREQSRKNIALLSFAVGSAFYLYGYLWQAALITLGLLFFYALIRKQWGLLKASFFSGLFACIIGSPVVLYALWLSHTSPYFWESVYRLGLVNTHLPMAEVIYSGGWVGVTCAFVAVLLWRVRALREDKEFVLLSAFIGISGFGLWIMQGSNLITGKLLETGEHVRILMLPWFMFCTIAIGVFLWRRRTLLSKALRIFSAVVIAVLTVLNIHYTYYYFSQFIPANINQPLWQTEETYVKPLAWLQSNSKEPEVVWSDPHDYLSNNIPIFTKDFTLYAQFGWFELMPEGEIRERYLVSQYFNNPTVQDLESTDEMALYIGRHDLPHEAETLDRAVKICKILFFWDKSKNCGQLTTPQQLLGDSFFEALETRFQTDIKPNIQAYLKKYHVSYIIKDKILDPNYHPETLGGKLVYSDDRYEIYHL